MNELVNLLQLRIDALEKRNAYLENELSQAKDLFQSLINEWEVQEAEILTPQAKEN